VSFLSACLASRADCRSLLSLELGRPAMIKEEDCDVSMPSPVDDQYIYEGKSNWTSPTPEQSTSPLVPTIQIIGGIAKLLRVLKSPRLPTSAIEAYESYFDKCIRTFPVQHQLRVNDYLDPIELPPIMYLQNARIVLHRHNLTPLCESESRSAAIDRCVLAARDTARFLCRCMREPPRGSPLKATAQVDTWEKRMTTATSAFLCTHIWRCTLFLCYRSDFEYALVCARASAVLGDSRPINTACGRYLDFFLKELISRLNNGAPFDLDEEMIAYVSADLQGSLERSWIWQESKGDVHPGKPLPSTASNGKGGIEKAKNSENRSPGWEDDWSGWDHILTILKKFVQEQQRERRETTVQRASRPSSGESASLTVSPTSAIPSNRMSIKDLI